MSRGLAKFGKCKNCLRVIGIKSRGLCAKCFRNPDIKKRYRYDGWGRKANEGTNDNMTTEEIDAVIIEQMRCLPDWWESESD